MRTLKKELILIVLLLMVLQVKTQVVFKVLGLSSSIANGTEEVQVSFVVKADSLVLPDSLTYNDISYFQIEKTEGGLNNRVINSINKTINTTSFIFTDTEIGNGTQEYKLIAVDNTGNARIIANETAFLKQGLPHLDCVKINHLYREACHNCYDPAVFSFAFTTAIATTKVVEIDIHIPQNPSSHPGNWDVRHVLAPSFKRNNNNCGTGDQRFNFCLKDIKAYIQVHPNHDPIIAYIDLKSAFVGPDHFPSDLDQLLINEIGASRIYKPIDLKGGFGELRWAAESENWPSLGNMKGKVIFVLTGSNTILNTYINGTHDAAVAFVAPNVANNGITWSY